MQRWGQGCEDGQANEVRHTKIHNQPCSLYERIRALQEIIERKPRQLRY